MAGVVLLAVAGARAHRDATGQTYTAQTSAARLACAVLQQWQPETSDGQWWRDPRADQVTQDAQADATFEAAFTGWTDDAESGTASAAQLSGDAADINADCAAAGVPDAVPASG